MDNLFNCPSIIAAFAVEARDGVLVLSVASSKLFPIKE